MPLRTDQEARGRTPHASVTEGPKVSHQRGGLARLFRWIPSGSHRASPTECRPDEALGQDTPPHSDTDREDILYETIRRGVLQRGLWYIDAINWQGGLEIQGWLVAPEGWFRETSFTVNGRRFSEVEINENRPDVVQALKVDPRRIRGFRSWMDRKDLSDGAKGFRIAYVDHRTLVPLVETQCKWLYEVDAPIPDPARRIRVAGTDKLGHFIASGGEWYGTLVQALETAFGKTFDDFPDVLDWGCGCARVLRYVSARHTINLIGVNIDADKIAWCESAFPTTAFHAIGLDPPLPLAAESIDLVYGLSVFTHLSERDQFMWLEELRRITRPGGVLLMTVQGEHAWFRSRVVAAADFVDWKRRGFRDDQADTVLKDFISDPNYYRSVFHDMHYVIREWGRFFRVVEYIPGMLQSHQDLVVLVRE